MAVFQHQIRRGYGSCKWLLRMKRSRNCCFVEGCNETPYLDMGIHSNSNRNECRDTSNVPHTNVTDKSNVNRKCLWTRFCDIDLAPYGSVVFDNFIISLLSVSGRKISVFVFLINYFLQQTIRFHPFEYRYREIVADFALVIGSNDGDEIIYVPKWIWIEASKSNYIDIYVFYVRERDAVLCWCLVDISHDR